MIKDMYLYQALKIIIRKDSGFLRTKMFSYLASRNLKVRLAWSLYDFFHQFGLAHLFAGLYGFKSFLALKVDKKNSDIISIGQYRNELRQFDYLEDLLDNKNIDRIQNSNFQLLNPINYLKFIVCLMSFLFSLKLLQKIERKHNFLITCRAASLFGIYLRLSYELNNSDYNFSIVASDSNPDSMALTAYFRSQKKKTIYIDHAYIPDQSPPLFFDLSLLSGEASQKIYKDKGIFGDVILKGLEGKYFPMKSASKTEVVGVCMTTMVDWKDFSKKLKDLISHLKLKKLILRLHPNKIIRDPNWKEYLLDIPELDIREGGNPLFEDIKDCDFVIGGESGVHLNILKFGIPSIHLKGIDLYPNDFYHFVRDGVLLSFDSINHIDSELIKSFYSEKWISKMIIYDSHYGQESNDSFVNNLKNFLGT